jgi:hypothetical protein
MFMESSGERILCLNFLYYFYHYVFTVGEKKSPTQTHFLACVVVIFLFGETLFLLF